MNKSKPGGPTILNLAPLFRRFALPALLGLALAFGPAGCKRLYSGEGAVSRYIADSLNPGDMYYPRLLEARIDVSRAGRAGFWDFRHRYRGDHTAGILLEKAWEDGGFRITEPETPLELEVNFFVGEEFIRSHSITAEDFETFSIDREIGRGYEFLAYESPRGLPYKRAITCEVNIITPDPDFQERYGPVTFYIRKVYDFSERASK